jgi:Tfp pilus assembly ATPase PilU
VANTVAVTIGITTTFCTTVIHANEHGRALDRIISVSAARQSGRTRRS